MCSACMADFDAQRCGIELGCPVKKMKKYCQQTRAGGFCAADAEYQIWRVRRGHNVRGKKRYFCERCLRAMLAAPALCDKIISERIG